MTVMNEILCCHTISTVNLKGTQSLPLQGQHLYQYINALCLYALTAIFPGEPGLAGVY